MTSLTFPHPAQEQRGGGGAAIAFNPSKFSVVKLNITIPTPLEIVWALMRPIEPTGGIKKVILCSFYSPPNSKKNKQLIDHISVTYNQLKIQHPDAATLMSGDKNSLDETNILALNNNFQQIVSQNTRKGKILTILITDLKSYYHVPQVIPPVPVDVQGQGVPSDHDGVLAVPITTSDSQRVAQSRKVKVRPLPDTLMRQFGNIIVDQSWSFLAPNMSSTQMVAAFEKHSSSLIENIFPEKTVTISEWDKPYMTEELKLLRRKRQRTYRKGGRSAKYPLLKA